MMQTNALSTVLFLATCAVACGRTTESPSPSGTDPAEAPPGPAASLVASSDYVLDFSGSKPGGVLAGRFTHVAFSLDRSAPKRTFALEAVTNQAVPGVVQSNDFVSCNNKQAQTMLERSVATLEHGQASFVDHVDVEMLASQGAEWKGAVCFGTRSAAGWKWSFTPTAMTYDAAIDRYRVRIPVQQGPVDAFKIAFDDGTIPEQPITKITVAMRPPS